jgi:hypothetical protein
MVLRRCLAGVLAVGATLAAAGCTTTPALQDRSAASSPVPAVAAASVGRTHGRRVMDPGGTGAQLVATGAVLGVVMATAISGQTGRAGGPPVHPGHLDPRHGIPPHSLPGHRLSRRDELVTEGRLARHGRRHRKPGRRRHTNS